LGAVRKLADRQRYQQRELGDGRAGLVGQRYQRPQTHTDDPRLEAVTVGFAAGLHAYYYDNQTATPAHLLQSMLGSAIKDTSEDRDKLRHYANHVVKERRDPLWQAFYHALHEELV